MIREADVEMLSSYAHRFPNFICQDISFFCTNRYAHEDFKNK